MQISLLLDRSRTDTLTNQLVAQLRDAIRLGRIPSGSRLPSSRRLADQLGIGRNTVVRAYEILEMGCFLEARPASGVFATQPPSDAPPAPIRVDAAPARQPILTATRTTPAPRLSFDFAPDQPNPALFPLKTWRRALQACLSQGGATGLTRPGDPLGLPALRAAIAGLLAASRGIVADPAQIIIVSGTSEALALAGRLAITPGARAVVEDPCGFRDAAILRAAGADVLAVPVDAGGLAADTLPDTPTAVLSLTPAHHYPTGHMLAPARREQIAAWARRTGCLIVENDRGADFRYQGGAPHALAAYAPDRTLHVGGFAQLFGHGIGFGYMVVPSDLVDAVAQARALSHGSLPWLEQAVLARLIESGSLATHGMRMRGEYRERRDALLDALQRNFGEVDVSGEAGGLHLFWQLPPGVPDATTVEALGRRARVGVYSLGFDRVHHPARGRLLRHGLMLGYAALSPKQIAQGIARLSDAVDDALDGRHIALGDLLLDRAEPYGPSAPLLPRRSGKPALRIRQQPALSVATRPGAASASRTQPGPSQTMPVVTGLYQYPIKGLSPQPVAAARIEAGRPFPFDRVFALARPGAGVTEAEPKWAKKGLFVMLMLDERLASVRSWLDPATLQLTVRDGPRTVLSADLNEAAGRRDVEAFFHRLAPSLKAAPTLVRSRDGHFMDKPDAVISLINLATLRALEQQWGYRIDPLRFRANIYVDEAPAWSEFDWIGGEVRVGETLFRADRRNGRCSATNVDPATGVRDLDIPGSLRRAFGHKDLGVYLVALQGGQVAVGDTLTVSAAAGAKAAAGMLRSAAAPAAASGTFICKGCYFIYREAEGHPAGGIAPGTRFGGLPGGWRCPDCGTDKSMFRPHLAG